MLDRTGPGRVAAENRDARDGRPDRSRRLAATASHVPPEDATPARLTCALRGTAPPHRPELWPLELLAAQRRPRNPGGATPGRCLSPPAATRSRQDLCDPTPRQCLRAGSRSTARRSGSPGRSAHPFRPAWGRVGPELQDQVQGRVPEQRPHRLRVDADLDQPGRGRSLRSSAARGRQRLSFEPHRCHDRAVNALDRMTTGSSMRKQAPRAWGLPSQGRRTDAGDGDPDSD